MLGEGVLFSFKIIILHLIDSCPNMLKKNPENFHPDKAQK